MTQLRHFKKHQQHGVALITVLGMLVIMTVLVAAMATLTHRNTKTTGSVVSTTQLQWYAYSAENLVKQKIQLNQQINSDVDAPVHALFADMPPFAVGDAWVQVHIKDATGCINLNNLIQNNTVNEASKQMLANWVSQFGVNSNAVDAIVDWIYSDDQLYSVNGAESAYYAGQNTVVAIANQPMTSVDEMAQMRGFEALANSAQWNTFQSGLCALPTNTPININFATAEVLSALDGNINKASLQPWLLAKQHSTEPFKTVDELWQSPVFKNSNVNTQKMASLLAVKSDYIWADITVTHDKQHVHLQSLIDKNTEKPMILARNWVQ